MAKAENRYQHDLLVDEWWHSYQTQKRRGKLSLWDDRDQCIASMLAKVEKMVDSNPKHFFQILSTWYKRWSGVNLLLAKCEMEELETEYTDPYQTVPSPGEPLRGQVGAGFEVPDTIPDEQKSVGLSAP